MKDEDLQSLSIRIQNFRKNFDREVLENEPKINYHEIEHLDQILKKISVCEKRIEKLETETDRQFVLKGNYYFKFFFIFGSTWFLLGKLVSVYWFALFVVSLFLSMMGFWFLISTERKKKLNVNNLNMSEIGSVRKELNRWMILKKEAETKFGVAELNFEFVEKSLLEFQFWQQHENERKYLMELTEKYESLVKEFS